MKESVWIGFDPRETDGFAVTKNSIVKRLHAPIPIRPLILQDLRDQGVYHRPTDCVDGLLYDVISEHPMATEFAISRFLVPHLVRSQSKFAGERWAVFMDSDMLVLDDIARLFEQADSKYAVMVVKHRHEPSLGVKMDNQVQSLYARKNWSSVMLFNVDHPANNWLTVDNVNSFPGRDLHRFCWLKDEDIGELSLRWNYLVGYNKMRDVLKAGDDGVSIVHFTEGLPSMQGYRNCEFAEEWREELIQWAR